MHHALQPTPGNCGVALFLIIGIVGTVRSQIACQVVGLIGSTVIGYLDRNRTEKEKRTWRARTQQVTRLCERLWYFCPQNTPLRREIPQDVALESITIIQDDGGAAEGRRRKEYALERIETQDGGDAATAPVSTIPTNDAAQEDGSRSTRTLRRRRPNSHSVHFPERDEDLTSVRLFKRGGRPVAVSLSDGDETEIETEDRGSSAAARYPFTDTTETESDIIIHPSRTSPIPCPSPSQHANVHLETLLLPRTRPYTLHGSVLVRNVSSVKLVAVRFTLDEWMTTSEVLASYASTMGVLPPPPFEEICHASLHNVGWDRFDFQIRLEYVEYPRRLADKVMWLCVRFTAESVGEWWDNNNGANYRVVFKKEVVGGET